MRCGAVGRLAGEQRLGRLFIALAARVGALEGDRPPPAASASAGPLVGHVAELSTPRRRPGGSGRHAPRITRNRRRRRPTTTARRCVPHTWTRRGDTLPEEYLAVEFPRGVWRLAFESACMGDLSSCPRPGDRVPTVYVRDIAEAPRRPSAGSGPARNGARTLNSTARCTGGCGSVTPPASPGP